jgi:hypothetical protein
MAVSYFPFDTGAGAGAREADWVKMGQFWAPNGCRILSSVGSLEVYGDNSGKWVKVKPGAGWINGQYYESDAEQIIAIGDNTSGNARIDRIVLRADRTANTIAVAVLAGTPAGSPTAPALTQTSTTWEMTLAQVAVANGFSSITAGDVTDERQWSGYVNTTVNATTTNQQKDWSMPWGVVDYKIMASDTTILSGGSFVSTDITGLSSTKSYRKNRLLKVSISAITGPSVTARSLALLIDYGSSYARIDSFDIVSTALEGRSAFLLLPTSADGTLTIKAQFSLSGAAANVTFSSGATGTVDHTSMVIEDIGPAGAPS